ncbi:MAG: PAS domain-containing protein [Planctomycetota bacterium]|jgi:PAS domain S-box-containing protein
MSSKYKILLLEDDSVDRKSIIRLVKKEKLPYDCYEAESLKKAQQLLSEQDFDVIVADYNLGDGTAYDILENIKDVPIIVVTGSGDEKVAIKAWRAGAYDYIIKDLDQNYLQIVPITIENAVQHKKTIEKLQLLSEAIKSTDDSVFITDIEDKIIFINKAFSDTYGYHEDEIIGMESAMLSDEIPDEQGEPVSYHRRKDGSEFPVSLSKSAIMDKKENEKAFITVVRDMSERLYLEDRIRAINLQLRKGIRSTN